MIYIRSAERLVGMGEREGEMGGRGDDSYYSGERL